MINSHILHLTGGASIEQAVENDTDYQIIAPITTFSVGDQRSRQDGTFDVHYKAKISGPVTLIRGDGVKIKGKEKKTTGQRIRGAAFFHANEEGIDPEKHYEDVGKKIAVYWSEVVSLLEHKH